MTLRGHKIGTVPQFPLIVEDAFESLTKASEVEDAFTSFGMAEDLTRVRDSRSVRAGKGKRRGRKMKQAVGPLIVVVD